jgi:O-antigen ligase
MLGCVAFHSLAQTGLFLASRLGAPIRAEEVFFRNSNFIGYFITAGAAVFLFQALNQKAVGFRILYVLGFFISLVGIILSTSRSAMAAFFSIACILFWKKYRVLILLPILLLVLVFVIPNPFRDRIQHLGEDMYAWTRIDIWKLDLRIWKDHPFLGIGPGQFEHYSPLYNFPVEGALGRYRKIPEMPHCDFLGSLLEVGPLGFICFLGLIAFAVYSGLRRGGKASGNGEKIQWISAALGFVMPSFFSDPLQSPAILYYIASMLVIVLFRKPEGKKVDEESRVEAVRADSYRPHVPSQLVGFLLLFFFFFAEIGFVLFPFLGHLDYRKARRLQADGNDREAERKGCRAVFFDAGNPLYHSFLGGIAKVRMEGDRGLESYYRARKEYEAARKRNPLDAAYIIDLIDLEESLIFHGSEGRIESLYGQAEALTPTNPFLWFRHALYLLSLGKSEESRARFKRAADIEPDFMRAHYFLCKLALKQGDWQTARQEAIKAGQIYLSHRNYRTSSVYEARLLYVPARELAEIKQFWENNAPAKPVDQEGKGPPPRRDHG